MPSWSEYFASVPDPRRQSALTKHLLSDILGLALCAMLCGADDFVEMAVFALARQQFLQEKLGFELPHGVPSHDTFTRVFARLNPHTLEQCLKNWLALWQQEALEPDAPRHLCIDGKLARGSWTQQTNACALSTVSIFASELRVMLCCARLPERGGENGLAPSLLELLDLEGAVVTGDAAYCQKSIAHTIHNNKGDYVFVLKSNHRLLHRQLQNAFMPTTKAHYEQEQGHGRCEERRLWCQSVQQLGLSAEIVQQWPGLSSIVRVERVRHLKSGPHAGSSHSVWFYLSSLAPHEEALAHAIRSHWSIENQAHWVLDVVFGEDRCRTQKEHAPYNLALMRRICLNLLRQNQGKNSLKATRKQVTWNNDLLLKILNTPITML